MALIIKKTVNKVAHTAGYHISKLPEAVKSGPKSEIVEVPQAKPIKPDPKEYSTMTTPMEVPCQKETYYFVLNNYIEPSSTVLDVGSGLGYGMNILSVLAKEVQGADVDKKAVDYSKKELIGRNPKIKDIKIFDGYKLPYKDSEFDVITCVDVLEHVEYYDKFVKELLRVSKKAVILSTPNRRAEFTNPDGTPRNYWHLREWNHKELDAILSKHCSVDWHFIDGPFEGPFKIKKAPTKDTLVLMPVLHKQSNKKK